MREGIIQPKFAEKFFRIDFEASPMPVLCLYPLPTLLKLEEVTLDVSSLEQHPRRITWSSLQELPRVTLKLPLICQIFNWSETVEWEGIRLVDLLDLLNLETHPEGFLAFYSRDRVFFEGLSRDEAHDPRVLLAYGLNGKALPEVHGGPLRLVVPFLQGYKSVKWIGAIHAFRHDPIGTKRLLGQSPTGRLNEQWKETFNIVPPLGKPGEPPLTTPETLAKGKEAFFASEPQPPVSGQIQAYASGRKPDPTRKGVLKEVIAIVRPGKHRATRKALEAAGIYSYTTTSVLGRSRQRGLRFQSEGEETTAIKFLPKQYFSIVLPETQLSAAIAVLIKVNRSGKGAFGDGKIFIVDLEDAVRISTGEQGEEAL